MAARNLPHVAHLNCSLRLSRYTCPIRGYASSHDTAQRRIAQMRPVQVAAAAVPAVADGNQKGNLQNAHLQAARFNAADRPISVFRTDAATTRSLLSPILPPFMRAAV